VGTLEATYICWAYSCRLGKANRQMISVTAAAGANEELYSTDVNAAAIFPFCESPSDTLPPLDCHLLARC
jgi:hypothetical protein